MRDSQRLMTQLVCQRASAESALSRLGDSLLPRQQGPDILTAVSPSTCEGQNRERFPSVKSETTRASEGLSELRKGDFPGFL